MSILAQQRGTEARPCTGGGAARALLEYAVAQAPSHIPPPRGLRRLLARDRSAAGLIRRYRLWPAIEHAYDRVSRELHVTGLEVSAEDGYGSEFVMAVFRCESWDIERMFTLGEEIGKECHSLLGESRWHRLAVTVEPHPDLPLPDE